MFYYLKLFRRWLTISKDLQINEEIRDKELRVIDSNGDQLGIMSAKRAQEIANERQLDLVKIAPQAVPPVCRITDYGKYRYELSKKEKEARKNQKIVNIKEVRLSAVIEDHDFNVKLKNAQKFLEAGDKVRVTIRFRGREVGHASIGEEIMKRFAQEVSDLAVVEKPPKLEGKNMTMNLAPKQG